MWNFIVVAGRIVIAVAAIAAVFVSILQTQGVLPKNDLLTASVTFVSLIVIALDNLVTLIRRGARDKRVKRELEISNALMALLLNVGKQNSLRFEQLGACVYVAKKPIWTRTTELVRISRFRPSGYPQQSGVTWRPKKGVVGQAWGDRKTTYKNWHAVAERYSNAEITDESFKKIGLAARSGFTKADFVSIVGKYSEILAEPIWDTRVKKKCIGIVAIDRQYEAGVAVEGEPLNHADTRSFLSTTAALLGTVLSTPTENVS